MKKLFFIFFGLASLNVYAHSCGGEYQPATGTCRIIDSSGRQILYNVGIPSPNSGYVQNNTEIININVPSKYGAWAVNPKTGISADAINAPSLEIAKEGAIKACEQGGRNAPCKVLAWVRNGCLAIAQVSRGNRPMIYSGHTGHPYRAEAEALKQCRAAGEPECKIIAPEGCSLPRF